MSFAKKMNVVKPNVEKLLRRKQKTRDCDKTLYIEYLDHYHFLKRKIMKGEDPYKSIKQAIIDAPPPESIRRSRQYLQEKQKELRGELYEVRQEAGRKMEKRNVKIIKGE